MGVTATGGAFQVLWIGGLSQHCRCKTPCIASQSWLPWKTSFNNFSPVQHRQESSVHSRLSQMEGCGVTHSYVQAIFCQDVCYLHRRQESPATGAARPQPDGQGMHDQQNAGMRPRSDATPGVSLSPSIVREVLREPAYRDNEEALLVGLNGPAQEHSQAGAVKEGLNVNRAASEARMDADAVLWAMHNLWFGVEADMTAEAYKVGTQSPAGNTMLSRLKYMFGCSNRCMMSCKHRACSPLLGTTMLSREQWHSDSLTSGRNTPRRAPA
jgi:hypothetical protein